MNNVYYNPEKKLLVIKDRNDKPVKAYGGNIAVRKYQEMNKRTNTRLMTRTDLQAELELCKSVVLRSVNLPPDIQTDYQRRYRITKKRLEQIENSLSKI